MIRISNGARVLYQWERGVTLTVTGQCDIVRLSREDDCGAKDRVPYTEGSEKKVEVPDYLLMESGYLRVSCIVKDGDSERVEETARFIIRPAQKSDNSAVSGKEIKSWQELFLRMKALERAAREGKFDGEDGITPHIGTNGNWFLGEVDTGIPATGEDGMDGKDGADGITPHIGENGNWYLGESDTGVKAQGDDGEDGITPHIGVNGNWYIGDVDTGVRAKGVDASAYANDLYTSGVLMTADTESFAFTGKTSDTGTPQIVTSPGVVYIKGVRREVKRSTRTYNVPETERVSVQLFRLDEATGEIGIAKWRDVTVNGDIDNGGEIVDIETGYVLPLRSGGYYDVLLCMVTLPAGATEVTPDMIRDLRGDERYCGYVSSKIGGESGGIKEETDPTVPEWAKQKSKPTYTAQEVGAQPAGDYPTRDEMPANTSDLTNDSGFITRLVSDLANYYTKSQTYTRTEVDQKVSAIPKFAISVVSSLPTSNINETTVYLVKSGTGGDLYTEYIYVNGAWEILGSQRVDLTGYATEVWVNKQISELTAADVGAPTTAEHIALKAKTVHIGTEAPTDGETVWIDTDEEPDDNSGTQLDVIAKPGQVIAVNAVDDAGKPTEYEAVDLPAADTPDFAANEGEAGYIENRTHYRDKYGIIHKLSNMYIDADWMATSESHGGGVEFTVDLKFTGAYGFLDPHWFPDAGIDWDIYWNGVKYSCSVETSSGEAFLGNRRLLGEQYPDSGEPFLFTGYALSDKDPELVMVQKNTSSNETINIVVEVREYTEYNKLPKEFLPDDIVTSVNGQTGEIQLDASDVGARPSAWMPTASDVGADASGTANSKVSEHNTSDEAHNDIRLLISGLTTRLNAIADSDDTTLDQLSEIVDYIKANKTLIDSITTSKVNVSDIIDNLTTSASGKPLSAKMGVELKRLIDAIEIPTELPASDVYDWAKQPNKPTYTAQEVGAQPTGDYALKSEIPTVPVVDGAGEAFLTYTTTFSTDTAAKNGAKLPNSLTGVLTWLEVNGELLKVQQQQSGMVMEWYDEDGNKWVSSSLGGVYVYAQTAGTYTYTMYASADTPMLDPKYIPPNVAKKSDIPQDSSTGGTSIDVTAEVGQTIVVKEIDENGKPTKWESADYPLTVYEIIPLTTYTAVYDSSYSVYVHQLATDTKLEAGRKYKVLFDGVEYTCEAFAGKVSGMQIVGCGNTLFAGGTNTGEPFALANIVGVDGYIFLFGLDGNEHEISISVTRLDDSYVPEAALPYYFDVELQLGDNNYIESIVAEVDFATIKSMHEKGRRLVGRVRNNVNNGVMAYYNLCVQSPSQFAFTGQIMSADGNILDVQLNDDGTTRWMMYFD